MPTYEYRCAKCGQHLEVHQSFSEKPLTKHAECGGKLAKVLSPAGIVLKGSGFYKTDNRSSSKKRSTATESKSGDTKSSSTSESSSGSDSGTSGSSGSSDSSSSSGSSSSTDAKSA
jgi:putative FmdB family regulatory protein